MTIPLETLDALDRISIANPCTVSWSRMRGNDKSRFCGECQKWVFDLSTMSRSEIAELLARPGATPCVRLYRRPDRRVLTADCSVGLGTRIWRKLRRRAAWAAWLLAILFVPACATRTMGIVMEDESQITGIRPRTDRPGDADRALNDKPATPASDQGPEVQVDAMMPVDSSSR